MTSTLIRNTSFRAVFLANELPLPPTIEHESDVFYGNRYKVNAYLLVKHTARWSAKKARAAGEELKLFANDFGEIFPDETVEELLDFNVGIYPNGTAILEPRDGGKWLLRMSSTRSSNNAWLTPARVKVVEV